MTASPTKATETITPIVYKFETAFAHWLQNPTMRFVITQTAGSELDQIPFEVYDSLCSRLHRDHLTDAKVLKPRDDLSYAEWEHLRHLTELHADKLRHLTISQASFWLRQFLRCSVNALCGLCHQYKTWKRSPPVNERQAKEIYRCKECMAAQPSPLISAGLCIDCHLSE